MTIFKNAIIYRIGPDWTVPHEKDLEEVLLQNGFTPCGATEQESVGWVPPRGEENAALAERIAGHIILKIAVERKSVPSGAVNAELEVRCKKIEAQTGRKVPRKEKKELKEDIFLEFLPRAFTKRSAHLVWIDPTNKYLVVGAGSHKAADHVVSHIVDLMASAGRILPISPLLTELTPATAMADWLTTMEAPAEFSIDRDVELKMPDDEKSTVRYARHNLEIAEIAEHIKQGKVPTQLAMTWEGRVSFTLTSNFVIRKIDIPEVKVQASGEGDNFDGTVVLVTGELIKMLPALLDALGGETHPSTAVEPQALTT